MHDVTSRGQRFSPSTGSTYNGRGAVSSSTRFRAYITLLNVSSYPVLFCRPHLPPQSLFEKRRPLYLKWTVCVLCVHNISCRTKDKQVVCDGIFLTIRRSRAGFIHIIFRLGCLFFFLIRRFPYRKTHIFRVTSYKMYDSINIVQKTICFFYKEIFGIYKTYTKQTSKRII